MDIKKLQRPELREKVITIRTFLSYSVWLKENKVSPSKLFNTAIEELMEEKKNGS